MDRIASQRKDAAKDLQQPLQQLHRLEELQSDDAEERITALLSHAQPEVRARAVLAAGRMRLASSFERLLELVEDARPLVRRQSVFALGLLVQKARHPLGTLRLEPVLLARLRKETDVPTKRRILHLLGATWGWEMAATIARHAGDEKTAEAALEGLVLLAQRGQLQESSLPVLLSGLTSPRPPQRLLAAMALAFAPLPPADKTLARQLEAEIKTAVRDADVQVAQWATRALGKLGQRSAGNDALMAALMAALMDHRPRVQVEAARALGAMGSRGVLRLTRGLAKLWRSTSANHFRLTGPQLHPILVGLGALEARSGAASVRRLARDMLELSDATDAAVTYHPKEAHAVDLVHCACARLWDLGAGRVDKTRSCGTAGSDRLTRAMRKAMVVRLLEDLRSRGGRSPGRTPGQPAEQSPAPSSYPPPGEDDAGTRSPASTEPLPTTARIVTHRGVIDLRLLSERAPMAVARFADGARKGQIRSCRFMQVSPFDRVQTGDLAGEMQRISPDEISFVPVVRGSVGVEVDAAGSRLFISLGRKPQHDGRRLQIGLITAGIEVAERLQPGDPILDVHVGVAASGSSGGT